MADETAKQETIDRLKAAFIPLAVGLSLAEETLRRMAIAVESFAAARERIIEAFEAAGGEFVDQCVGCRRVLFVGDMGFAYDDGPVSCRECAPTYESARDEAVATIANATSDEDDKGRARATLAAIEGYIAGGGSLTDKQVYPL